MQTPLLRTSWILLALLMVIQPVLATPTIQLVSHNMNRLFDDKDDGNREKVESASRYAQRLQTVTAAIKHSYRFAEIIALQEVENIDVLRDIAARIRRDHDIEYRAILVEGNDLSGIDVGFLVHESWAVNAVEALFSKRKLGRKAPLFSRPPLLVELCRDQCVTVVNVHLRSMRGLRSANKSRKVASKRRQQAETLARWIERRQTARPDEALVIIGDFNALTPSDEYVDVTGIIRGAPDPNRPRWPAPDLISRDLVDITMDIPADRRVSFVFRRQPQQLDYALVSSPLASRVRAVRFSRIDYKLSDHAALIVEVDWP